jgi:hypothetical protein
LRQWIVRGFALAKLFPDLGRPALAFSSAATCASIILIRSNPVEKYLSIGLDRQYAVACS